MLVKNDIVEYLPYVRYIVLSMFIVKNVYTVAVLVNECWIYHIFLIGPCCRMWYNSIRIVTLIQSFNEFKI